MRRPVEAMLQARTVATAYSRCTSTLAALQRTDPTAAPVQRCRCTEPLHSSPCHHCHQRTPPPQQLPQQHARGVHPRAGVRAGAAMPQASSPRGGRRSERPWRAAAATLPPFPHSVRPTPARRAPGPERQTPRGRSELRVAHCAPHSDLGCGGAGCRRSGSRGGGVRARYVRACVPRACAPAHLRAV